MKTKRGFTLIELLVVIAVIGILAGIVLVSVRKAPDSAKDVRIKSALTQLRSVAQMEQIENNSFVGICSGTDLATSTELAAISADIDANGGEAICYASADAYCVYSVLKTDATKTFCVDSTGVAKEYSTTSDCTGGTDFTCESD